MKRYIRTKGGIYEFQYDNENESTLAKEVVVIKDGELTCLNKSKIIDQADTIEDLCDEFVVLEYGIESGVLYSRSQYITLEDAVASQTSTHKCSYEIYGAIWTDKGLIYVAKMNDKGDLELIAD